MTKKEYCLTHPAIAYYSSFGGVEIHGFDYGINDYVYCVSNAWYGGEKSRRYHKLQIKCDFSGNLYFMLNGYKILFNECIKMGI